MQAYGGMQAYVSPTTCAQHKIDRLYVGIYQSEACLWLEACIGSDACAQCSICRYIHGGQSGPPSSGIVWQGPRTCECLAAIMAHLRLDGQSALLLCVDTDQSGLQQLLEVGEAQYKPDWKLVCVCPALVQRLCSQATLSSLQCALAHGVPSRFHGMPIVYHTLANGHLHAANGTGAVAGQHH